jgi:hypothetical protein
MQLHLTFANGKIGGDGSDDIGRFLIKGRYDGHASECYWTKSYVGSHDVSYRGFRGDKGIWDTWEIGILNHGGFHIWPKQAGDSTAAAESEMAAEPMDAIATQISEAPLTPASYH